MLKRYIVVIGAPAGGFEAVRSICANLPTSFPAPVFVVVHIPQPHAAGWQILGALG
jgi:two-component system chemotaxis response regulator CheB